jgi:hypothetical protein
LSLGAKGADQIFDGITVVAEIATADVLRKILLDGFIIRFFAGLLVCNLQISASKHPCNQEKSMVKD